jgi:cytochrome c
MTGIVTKSRAIAGTRYFEQGVLSANYGGLGAGKASSMHKSAVILSAILASASYVEPLLGSPSPPRATLAEAQTLLEKAAAHYRSVGREQALADFSTGKPPFRDRDLYVVCVSPDHLLSANGALPKWVGMTADIVTDVAGTPLGAAMVKSVEKMDEGTVSYKMINPVTQRMEQKRLYTVRLEKDVCGVGAYSAR